MPPLVSAVTPTYNRREFWPRCVRCFLTQDYPNLEWIILDNGTDPIIDLLPQGDPRIKYHRIEEKTLLGGMMNECLKQATGEICIVHDDDDWYAPDRIRKQVQPLLDNANLQVTGTGQLYYYVHGKQQAFRYRNLSGKTWIGAIAMRRSAWELYPFANTPHGWDFNFLHKIPVEQWCDLNDLTLLVASIHPNNSCSKRVPSPSFIEEPWEKVNAIAQGQL